MSEMAAPRALVFPPLVKVNKALETRLQCSLHLCACLKWLLPVAWHQGSTEIRKTLEQNFIFQIGPLNPNGINERISFN